MATIVNRRTIRVVDGNFLFDGQDPCRTIRLRVIAPLAPMVPGVYPIHVSMEDGEECILMAPKVLVGSIYLIKGEIQLRCVFRRKWGVECTSVK